MSNHAGFASAVVLDESVINLVLGVYYDNELVDVSLEKTFPVTLLGLTWELTFGLTLGKPTVDLSAAQEDRIGVAAALEGSIRIKGPLGGVHSYEVVMDLGVLIRPAVEITDGGRIQIGADFSDAELTELSVSLPGGGVLSSDHGKVLRSEAVRDVIQEFLQKFGTKGFKLSPEILSGTEKLNLALDTVVVRVLPDALVIGVDVNPDHVDAVNRGEVPFVEPDLATHVAGAVTQGLLSAQKETPTARTYIVAVPGSSPTACSCGARPPNTRPGTCRTCPSASPPAPACCSRTTRSPWTPRT